MLMGGDYCSVERWKQILRTLPSQTMLQANEEKNEETRINRKKWREPGGSDTIWKFIIKH